MSRRQHYFEHARDWALDRQARESRLLRIAWLVAGVAVGVALFEAVALAMLVPLKTVQPVTLLVDRQTGFVQALDPTRPTRIGADSALTQAFLAQYVTSREGFDRATVARDYRRVALWSGGAARTQYLSLMPATNPASPLQRFTNGTIVDARIKSVSRLSDGVALVRFNTQSQDRTGRTGPIQPWISVVRYRYSVAVMSFDDRLINPLGFQVTSYRRDAEAPVAVAEQLQPSNTVASDHAGTVYSRPVAPDSASSAIEQRMAYRGLSPRNIPLGSPLLPVGITTQDQAQ